MKITIKLTLIGIFALLGVIIGATDWAAEATRSTLHSSLTTIYHDRVEPMEQLKEISDAYAVFVVDASHKVHNGNFSWEEGLKELDRAKEVIDKDWAAYAATYLTPEEKVLVDEVTPLMAQAGAASATLRNIFVAKDNAALDDFVRHQLYQSIDPVTEKITQLIGIQVTVARDEFDKASAANEQAELIELVLIALAVIAIAAGGFVVIVRVTRSLSQLTRVMGSLAEGDKTVEIPGQQRQDELGTMARAVLVFKNNMIEADRLRAEQEDLKKQAEAERRQGMLEMADRFEATVGGIVATVTSAAEELQVTAQSLSATAEETSQQSTAVAAASEEMSVNVQTVASATEELTASIHEISAQVIESTRIVDVAVTQAEATTHRMSALSNASFFIVYVFYYLLLFY